MKINIHTAKFGHSYLDFSGVLDLDEAITMIHDLNGKTYKNFYDQSLMYINLILEVNLL